MPFISRVQMRKFRSSQQMLAQEVLMYQRVMAGMRRGISLETLFKMTIRSVQKVLGFKRCGIFLLDRDSRAMTLALGVDKLGRFEKNKDHFPIVRRRGANAFSDIINGYSRYFFTNHLPQRQHSNDSQRVPVRSTAVVPIQVGGGKIIGALAVDQLSASQLIMRSDVSSLFNIDTQVGLALQSVKIQEHILDLSVTDQLTGLRNRRFFDQALDMELKRCQRYNRAVSLIMGDLDHFKRINDTYGHDAGDEVLKRLANVLRDNLRNVDFVARIGGEEFAILLPETPPNNISVVAKRLLRQVREAELPIPMMNKRHQKITISLGLASYRRGKVKPQQFVKLADKSLYQAKRRGRNQAGSVQVVSN